MFQSLNLRNNGLHSLPATLLKMCTQLSTLDLHGTQITNDVLRQVFSILPLLILPPKKINK